MKANGRRPPGTSRRRIVAGIGLASAVVMGCNVLTGAADLSVDGTEVAPGSDGGTASPDAAGDAGAEGSKADAARDAGVDAAVPAPPCSSGMVFCDDFDDGTLAKWGVVKLGGSNAVVDQLAATSAPSSLLMTFPATPAANTTGAELQATIGAAPRYVRLTASVRLESGDNDKPNFALLTIAFGNTYALRVLLGRNGNAQMEESKTGPGANSTSTAGVSRRLTGAFQSVQLEMALDPSPTLTVQIDGLPAGTKGLTPPATLEPLRIVLGDSSVSGNELEWRVRFDNVGVVTK
ncbi:MAG: hypothetical protein JST00_22175 [Deltaproteobacteria bacterium]|nr:hypothetical protein [Deltaproteobacteria bacterium]